MSRDFDALICIALVSGLALMMGCQRNDIREQQDENASGNENLIETPPSGAAAAPDDGAASSPRISGSSKKLSVEDPFYAHSYPRFSQSTAPHVDDAAVEVKRLTLAQDSHNVQIARFAQHLASKGFRLSYDEERREWHTTEPIVGEYVIRFNIGTFPVDSTLHEMQLSLLAINLAFGLNPDARLAMSDPGLVRLTPNVSDRRDLQDALSSKEFQNARDSLKRRFLEYRPSVEK